MYVVLCLILDSVVKLWWYTETEYWILTVNVWHFSLLVLYEFVSYAVSTTWFIIISVLKYLTVLQYEVVQVKVFDMPAWLYLILIH